VMSEAAAECYEIETGHAFIPAAGSRASVRAQVDLSRFDAAPLIAFTATKETNYGTWKNRRIP
jgi:hypothetical protein